MMKLQRKSILPAIRTILHDDVPASKAILHTRGSGRGTLLRVSLPGGNSIIVKVWFVRNIKEWLRSFTHVSNAQREWRMHRRIHRAGLSTPEPLGFYRTNIPGRGICELVAVEDLGRTSKGLPHLKELIAHGKEASVLEFEDRLIEETAHLLRHGIVDIDHQLNNFVVDDHDRLFRIDFECARRYPLLATPSEEATRMLARLITGHVHAVQPDVERSRAFADRLYSTLQIGSKMRALVQAEVDANLAKQLKRNGIATRVALPE